MADKKRCRASNCFILAKKDGFCKSHYEQIFNPKKKTAKQINSYQSFKRKPAKHSALWDLFSVYIRLRDTDRNGYGNCIVTGVPITYIEFKDPTTGRTRVNSNCDAGHYVSRGCKTIWLHFDNVHAQGRQSNRFQGENKPLFRAKLAQKIGEERTAFLDKKCLEWGSLNAGKSSLLTSSLGMFGDGNNDIFDEEEAKTYLRGLIKELKQSKSWYLK